ncbi:glycoside hydrolase family 25 protein [Niabella sp. CC-SYL272]|uniref:glycoside hydrolase family 25 protein n=1 Tax=Niabella agricola TaxID=2891571 RepID=UPI001F3562DF|nr:glycoside hydrolase family 25 protein [Niabella agricola]MCF3111141.1 glycoside hydrolase family 25 protein [Niabella agricola]
MAVRKKRRRKKKGMSYQWKLVLSLLVLALLIGGLFVLDWSRRFELEVKRYPEFGIEIPVDYSLHGIDVSRYQKRINWEEVKAMDIQHIRISFAFIKATEGEKDLDLQFKRNWKNARQTGLPIGAYHFFIPSRDPVKQAVNFIKNVRLKPGDLPPVLDVEQTNNLPAPVIQARSKAWLQLVEQHYGVKPVVYTNADFYEKYLGKAFDEYPLWVAHYYEKRKPRIKRNWALWQHNDAGHVNGIDANVDFNVFNGDSVTFRAFLIQ